MTIIDTNCHTATRLDCLQQNGVKAVIRYYARTTKQKEKRLTQAEAEAILSKNMKIGVVCQSAGDRATYFPRRWCINRAGIPQYQWVSQNARLLNI